MKTNEQIQTRILELEEELEYVKEWHENEMNKFIQSKMDQDVNYNREDLEMALHKVIEVQTKIDMLKWVLKK
jgi:macrodomain Ter protein organizer (MatP/YcbG family)